MASFTPAPARAARTGGLLVPVLSRCNPPMKAGSALSAGTQLGGTFRTRHDVLVPFRGLRLCWVNWYTGAGGVETNGTDVLTVKAAVEYPAGTVLPVFFDGRRQVEIEPGGARWCDEIGVAAAAGEALYTRTFVRVAALGGKWPQQTTISFFGDGEGSDQSNVEPPPDRTDEGAAAVTATPNQALYSPSVSAGLPAGTPSKVVLAIGDSIATGNNVGPPRSDHGFLERPLRTGLVAHQRVALGGAGASNFITAVNSRRRFAMVAPLLGSFTHAVVALGVNDRSNPVATIRADLERVWRYLSDLGMRVWQTTITPVTTSTDGWATVGNQARTVPGSDNINAVNDWIRTRPAPLAGYFEIADRVETARNSGIWQPGLTADGIHPNTAGHDAAALGFDPALLV